MIINVDQHGRLCPQSLPPVHPLHAQTVTVLDDFYEAAPKDADGEFEPGMSAAYTAASSGPNSRMNLYREEASDPSRPLSYIVAYFWRCQVCGFVLPAQQVPRT